MKLLLITQKVDRTDPILGFFHRWIQEFAKQCESVTVIAQQVGEYDLPENVQIISLGKENGRSTYIQVLYFWHLLVKLASHHDNCLVHMTPIWVVLGWPLWFFLRFPVYLWYEARGTRWPLRASLLLVRGVFSASKAGMPLSTSKSHIVGHGIDIERFAPAAGDREQQIVTVGRITRAKHVGKILEAFSQLPADYRLTIVGKSITAEDQEERTQIDAYIRTHTLHDRVTITSVTQDALPEILQRSKVFLHASETSLDKAVLESMACGCVVVSCSPAATQVLPAICRSDADAFGKKAQGILSLSSEEYEALSASLRDIVVQHHSLSQLISTLIKEMSTKHS